MISTNDIRPGMALNLPEGLCQVVDYQHVKPGKGKAFVRMKLRRVDTGAVIDRTFRAGESVEVAVIDRRDFQFLYSDGTNLVFMDTETFEQVELSSDVVGDAANYLADNIEVIIPTYQGARLGVELPAAAVLEVSYAEPGVKGDRVSGGTKPVTLKTGLVVQVPLFIEQGERIKVDTRTGEYIERAQ
jgi:elongation factor P